MVDIRPFYNTLGSLTRCDRKKKAPQLQCFSQESNLEPSVNISMLDRNHNR